MITRIRFFRVGRERGRWAVESLGEMPRPVLRILLHSAINLPGGGAVPAHAIDHGPAAAEGGSQYGRQTSRQARAHDLTSVKRLLWQVRRRKSRSPGALDAVIVSGRRVGFPLKR